VDSSGQTLRRLPSLVMEFWEWILDGIRPTLPRFLLGLGRFRSSRIRKLDGSLNVAETSGLAYGILGDAYPCAAPNHPEVEILILPDELQYRRVVPLSSGVLRRGRAGVQLQLEDLSPIPSEQVVFAYRDTGEVEAGQHLIELSIAEQIHPSDLLMEKAPGVPVIIAGEIGSNNAPAFVYDARGFERRSLTTLALAASLAAAVFLALFGWNARLDAAAASLRTEQVRLIEQVRQAREVEVDLQALVDAPVSQLRLRTALRQLSEVSPTDGGLQTVQQVRLQADGSLLLLGRDANGQYREETLANSEAADE